MSFDIFDTLVKRDSGSHDDLLRFAAMRVGVAPEKFLQEWLKADALASNLDPHYTFADIYKKMTGFSDEELDRLRACELSLEIELATPCAPAGALFESVKVAQLPIVLLSDMYLPEETIQRILEKCGYVGYRRLFVSNEVRANKRSGQMFRLAAEEIGRPLSGLVHVGDSPRRDFLMPRVVGAKSILVHRSSPSRPLKPLNPRKVLSEPGDRGPVTGLATEQLAARMLDSFLANRSYNKLDPFEKFGYEALGPLLFGFSRWVETQASVRNIRHLVFLARDGLILQEAYDRASVTSQVAKSTYLYVSRRSLRAALPAIRSRTDSLLAEIFFTSRKFSALDLLKELGLSEEQSYVTFEALDCDPMMVFNREDYRSNEMLLMLVGDVEKRIIESAHIQLGLIGEYLGQEEISGKVGLVDSGWSGSIQYYFQAIAESLGVEMDVAGFYLGVAGGARERVEESDLDLSGYLADYANRSESEFGLDTILGFIEAWLYAPHGTTIGYARGVEGKLRPLLEETNEKLVDEADGVVRAQRAALDFLEDFAHHPFANSGLTVATSFSRFAKVARHPSHEQIKDFHIVSNNGQRLTHWEGWLEYGKHPEKLLLHFQKSRWKGAFMRRIFRLPLPYDTLYQRALKFGLGSPKGRSLRN